MKKEEKKHKKLCKLPLQNYLQNMINLLQIMLKTCLLVRSLQLSYWYTLQHKSAYRFNFQTKSQEKYSNILTLKWKEWKNVVYSISMTIFVDFTLPIQFSTWITSRFHKHISIKKLWFSFEKIDWFLIVDEKRTYLVKDRKTNWDSWK